MALKISVSFSSLHLTVDKQELASLSSSFGTSTTLLSFVSLNQSIGFVNLQATDVRLNADTKNQYFIGDNPNALNISIVDEPELFISTQKADSLSITEQSVLSLDLAKSETIGMAENIALVVSFVRAFSDEPTLVDSPAINFVTTNLESLSIGDAPVLSIQPEKNDSISFIDSEFFSVDPEKSETVSVTDQPSILSAMPHTDNATVSESSVLGVDKAIEADSVSMSESLGRTVTYTRSFSDAYALDDVASAFDNLKTDFDINKNNILSITELLNYSMLTSRSDTASLVDSPSIEFTTSFSDGITLSDILTSDAGSIYVDGASLSDQEVISFSKALSDSASITESINVVLISGSNSVLNTSAFNTSVLN